MQAVHSNLPGTKNFSPTYADDLNRGADYAKKTTTQLMLAAKAEELTIKLGVLQLCPENDSQVTKTGARRADMGCYRRF